MGASFASCSRRASSLAPLAAVQASSLPPWGARFVAAQATGIASLRVETNWRVLAFAAAATIARTYPPIDKW